MAREAGGAGRRTLRRVVPIAVSVLLLGGLWWRVDVDAVLAAMRQARPAWVVAGILALIPLMWGSAIRFQWLSRAHIGTGLCTRLILAASTLNLFLPSKMGDLAKAWVLDRRHGFDGKFALALVIFEKLLDLASLLLWGVLALRVDASRRSALPRRGRPGAGGARVARLPDDAVVRAPQAAQAAGRLLGGVARTHPLVLERPPPRAEHLGAVARVVGRASRAAVAVRARAGIRAGGFERGGRDALDPRRPAALHDGGIGIRDLAIVYFYRAWLSPAQCAALGMLATLRYLLPAIVGLPFVSDYWRPAERPA